MKNPMELLANPNERTEPRAIQWLTQSKIAAVAWTAMRVWLGAMWIEAVSRSCGEPRTPAFLHNNGAGVAGFAGHGVAAYSWWGSFLHSFVVPNSGWIGILVAVAEFAIGIGLCLGLFTRVAALGSLALLFTHVMSGTASVCAFYAIVILATWKTSSLFGVDGLIAGYRQRHHRARHFTPVLSHSRGHAAAA